MIYERNITGLNAGTSADDTTYWVNFLNKIELWFSMERPPSTPCCEFYQEIGHGGPHAHQKINPAAGCSEFLAAAFKAHPYGSPTIGHQSDLEHLGRREAEASSAPTTPTTPPPPLWAAWTRADHQLAERYFSPWARPQRADGEHGGASQQGEKRVTVHTENSFVISYHRPGVRNLDDPVFDVLDDILSGGRSSGSTRPWSGERNALGVSSFTGMPGNRYEPVLLLRRAGRGPHHRRHGGLHPGCDRPAHRGAIAPRLDGVKTRVRADFIRGLDSNNGLANQLASAQHCAATGASCSARRPRSRP